VQHEKKDMHKQAIKYLQDDIQSKLFFSASSTSLISDTAPSVKLETINYSDGHLVADIYWLVKMANWNYSLRTVDHVGDTFQTAKLHPDSV